MLTQKLIIIEGTDSCGKATQTKLAGEALNVGGQTVNTISFPDYDSESSRLTRMYLAGEIYEGEPNKYGASLTYAMDRHIRFEQSYKKMYNNGILLSDRYTISNWVHQGAQCSSSNELMQYVQWSRELEFGKLGLPAPDIIFYLDVPVWLAEKRMIDRGRKQDILEADKKHQTAAREVGALLAGMFSWNVISALYEDGSEKSVQAIHQEIMEVIHAHFNQERRNTG